MVEPMSDELADLLELALAIRPERVRDAMRAGAPAEVREGWGVVEEAMAALAVADDPKAPPAGLRARIGASVAARRARKPCKAVVVCDMLNDHLTPGRPLEVPRARDVVPALAKRLDDARASGVPVIYILDRHAPDDPDLEAWGTHNLAGTEGAEVWPALAPKPGDHQVVKRAYSAFHDTSFEELLDELRVDTLVLTGCATDVQIMTTASDALHRGFAVEVPADSQAGSSEANEQAVLTVLSLIVPYVPARKARLERLAAHS
jgi:nicotinamidase-related amidase